VEVAEAQSRVGALEGLLAAAQVRAWLGFVLCVAHGRGKGGNPVANKRPPTIVPFADPKATKTLNRSAPQEQSNSHLSSFSAAQSDLVRLQRELDAARSELATLQLSRAAVARVRVAGWHGGVLGWFGLIAKGGG